jgi:hypothetical protein
MKEIKQTSEQWDAGIQKVKGDTENVRAYLVDSIEEQKDDVETEFNAMWREMF